MKALILNSGLGSRMGIWTATSPKCMVEVACGRSILDYQLQNLSSCGIGEAIITTGPFADKLEHHVRTRHPDFKCTFVQNPFYEKTNYIYSIALAAQYLQDDIILMHGDLVFEQEILKEMICQPVSCMAIDKSAPLPEKDFKAVLNEGIIEKVGVEFFRNAVAAQPLYYLKKKDWRVWLDAILDFCAQDNWNVYAENALNTVSNRTKLCPYDISGHLCAEVDNPEDLERIRKFLAELEGDK